MDEEGWGQQQGAKEEKKGEQEVGQEVEQEAEESRAVRLWGHGGLVTARSQLFPSQGCAEKSERSLAAPHLVSLLEELVDVVGVVAVRRLLTAAAP